MLHDLVITDVTRMVEQRVCVAGYVLGGDNGPWCVRPEIPYQPLVEPWLLRRGAPIIRPFAVVQLDLLEHRPRPPHSEDWHIDGRHRLPRGSLSVDQRRELLRALDDGGVDRIFGTPVHQAGEGGAWFVRGGAGDRSLGTVRVSQVLGVTFEPRRRWAKWHYRLAFADDTGQTYNLPVTDLAYRYFLDMLRDVEALTPAQVARHLRQVLREADDLYLRIGLARGWGDHPDRCHLQINGVYAFPDYLDGRCFADLAPPPPKFDLSDVPF